MVIDRREFLLTTFSTALSAYLVRREIPPKEIDGKQIVGRVNDTVITEDDQIVQLPPVMDHYEISKSCVFGLIDDGKPICRLLGQQVGLTYAQNAKVWQQVNCMLRVGRLYGPHADMTEFLRRLGDIANKSEMWFAIDPLREDADKTAFLLNHPVLTNVGMSVSTAARVCDAYGHNGGRPIETPEHARMMICEKLQFMCAFVPERLTNFKIPYNHPPFGLEVGSSTRNNPYGDPRISGEQITQEQALLASEANRDLDAWGRASVVLESKSTYPAPVQPHRDGIAYYDQVNVTNAEITSQAKAIAARLKDLSGHNRERELRALRQQDQALAALVKRHLSK